MGKAQGRPGSQKTAEVIPGRLNSVRCKTGPQRPPCSPDVPTVSPHRHCGPSFPLCRSMSGEARIDNLSGSSNRRARVGREEPHKRRDLLRLDQALDRCFR
jgi:hypothetical protein